MDWHAGLGLPQWPRVRQRPLPERISKTLVEKAKRLLDAALGPSKLVTHEEGLLDFGGDESENDPVLPDIVVRAESPSDIAKALQIANECDVPITPRGAGSGKSGGAIPVRGGIVLATAGMNQICEIDRDEHLVVVEPGVILGDLHRAVEAEGLFYPPDANSLSWCALGGNIAENAGGPRAFKYGVTRGYVLGLDVALMSGARMSVGRRTKKGVTGYDLTALLVGSEGTLAVTTRATLSLIPKPEHVVTLLALFEDVRAAGAAVTAVVSSGIIPRCIEILDDATLSAVRTRGVSIDPRGRAMLIIEVDGSEPECERAMERLGGECDRAAAITVLVAQDEAQRDRLWEARRALSPTTRAMAKFKVSEDVVVPRRAIVALLAEVDAIRADLGIGMLSYGHAGDGNLHVNFLWDDPALDSRVALGQARLFRKVVELRGTLTGEHGVGLSKQEFLSLEQAPDVIDLQKNLKRVFDPKGLLNPDKIFPRLGSHGAC
jgi:glycolate oxidase